MLGLHPISGAPISSLQLQATEPSGAPPTRLLPWLAGNPEINISIQPIPSTARFPWLAGNPSATLSATSAGQEILGWHPGTGQAAIGSASIQSPALLPWLAGNPTTNIYSPPPTARFPWLAGNPSATLSATAVEQEILGWRPGTGHAVIGSASIQSPALLPWLAGTSSWAWRLAPNRPRQEIHICVLTGGHVALPDIELPISSWQARLRDTDPTYVSAVIPNALAYTDAIIARTGGQLKIYKGYKFIDQAGGRFLALAVETSLHSIRHDTGPRSSSITLVGYANITNAAPKTVAYEALTYRSLQADGKRRWRTGLKLNISAEMMAGDTWGFIAHPGDTVIHNGESMVVGFISLAVSDTMELVELVEA